MAVLSTNPIYPQNHAMGAVASFSESTDLTPIEKRHQMSAIFSKYNFGASVFHSFQSPLNNDTLNLIDFEGMEEYGRFILGDYHRTQLYNDITQPQGIIRGIPDYESLEYTEYGASKFAATTDGDVKANREPNHGQQMYDVSNGELGWDSVLGYGTSNGSEFKGLIKTEKKWLEQFKKGKPVIDLSYSLGNAQTPQIRLPYVLVGRNSLTNGNTDYGVSKINSESLGLGSTNLSHSGLCSLPLTLRDISLGSNFTASNAKALDTINNNGWYRSFTHWQNIVNVANMDGYLSGMATQIAANFIFSSSFGMVAAYKLLRDSFTTGSIINDDGGFVDLEINLDIAETINPMYLLQPLSFRIDLTGTVLEGLEIECADAVRIFKESTDIFTIDIDLRNYSTGRTVRITNTLTPSYTSKAKPVISNIAESGGVITFDTDIPTRSELFYTPRGNTYYNGVTLVARSNTLGTSHSFDLNDTAVLNQIQPSINSANVLTNDVYLAVNSDINQSVLSTAQQFA